MIEIALVVFDLAGTTVRDGGQVPEAFTAALKDHDIEVTPERLNRVRGFSKREAIGVLSGAHGRELLERAPHTHLLPSIAGLRDVWRAA
jgi:phosphoglycolate phosphatase-like HAD superfamily hydrolase